MQLKSYIIILLLSPIFLFGQSASNSANDSTAVKDTVSIYKKRVLETTEIDFISSYYNQDGKNAAVTGGKGTEELMDVTGTFIISIPLNDDDILTIDAGVSAYTSASSGNVGPFDNEFADPFVAGTGASSSDVWTNVTLGYSHSSDNRNRVWGTHVSVSSEYDYFSIGFGGSYTMLFNEKNTELSFSGNIYLDTWNPIYPVELRAFEEGNAGSESSLFQNVAPINNIKYNSDFKQFTNVNRNSYSVGAVFSQILSKNLQMSLATDVVRQSGLLSTPLQRVYFSDKSNYFIDNFHLADDVERLPDRRTKFAIGTRFHYFISARLTLRTFYRYYQDDWGINSHTANFEVPIKLNYYWTIYPSYRHYQQSAADYFNFYNENLSTDSYYTSDYDLSKYNSNQFGFGLSYTNAFSNFRITKFKFKSIDLRYYNYSRNSPFKSSIVTWGVKFVMD